MARFLIYTNENHERQNVFVSHFYQNTVKLIRDDGIHIWYLEEVGGHIIATSEAVEEIFILTLYAEFLTNLDDVVHKLNFHIDSLHFHPPKNYEKVKK